MIPLFKFGFQIISVKVIKAINLVESLWPNHGNATAGMPCQSDTAVTTMREISLRGTASAPFADWQACAEGGL